MLLKQCPSPDDCQKESSCESSAKKPCSKERKKKTKSRSSSKGKKEGCLGKCCLFGGGGKHGGFGKSVCCCDEDKKKGKKKKNKKDKCCSGMKKSDQMVCCSSSDTSRSSSRCWKSFLSSRDIWLRYSFNFLSYNRALSALLLHERRMWYILASWMEHPSPYVMRSSLVPHDHLLLDSTPNPGPLISR